MYQSRKKRTKSFPPVEVELVKRPLDKLLNRWRQRRDVHKRLHDQGQTGGHLVVSQTLGFCIRELEDELKRNKSDNI